MRLSNPKSAPYKECLKRAFWFSMFFFLFLSTPLISHSASRIKTAIILSSDKTPYKQVRSGIVETLTVNDIEVARSQYNLKQQSFDSILQDIERIPPDIIFSVGTKTTKLTKANITDIPVIFSMVFNPDSLLSNNINGVSLRIPFIMKLKIIRKIMPDAGKIGVIYTDRSESEYKEIVKACEESEFELTARKIIEKKEFPEAVQSIYRKIDLFVMISDSSIYFPQSIKYLLTESLKHKFPVVGLSSLYTKAGALTSIECDYTDIGRQSGEMALEIINTGVSPDRSAVKPRNTIFSINLLVAERLGIILSGDTIKEAYKVYGK